MIYGMTFRVNTITLNVRPGEACAACPRPTGTGFSLACVRRAFGPYPAGSVRPYM
jgi:hypothetical protein